MNKSFPKVVKISNESLLLCKICIIFFIDSFSIALIRLIYKSSDSPFSTIEENWDSDDVISKVLRRLQLNSKISQGQFHHNHDDQWHICIHCSGIRSSSWNYGFVYCFSDCMKIIYSLLCIIILMSFVLFF